MVDLKFTDLPGGLQHISLPSERFSPNLLEEGVGFDGSSIRGFAEIQESDMQLIPDRGTAFMDPVYEMPTLSFFCNVHDPVTGERYWNDPRYIASKAEDCLIKSGIADRAFMGPEAEFFILDSVRFDQNEHSGYYFVDSEEGIWNSGAEGPNLGHRPRYKGGYFPVPPTDSTNPIRAAAMRKMIGAGIEVEVHHHEVATAGQGEIGIRYQTLTKAADHIMLYKYIMKNVGREFGKTVTFMPKPLFGDNGTGMHVHVSLSKEGENLFYGEEGYAQLGIEAMHFMGGLLEHAPSLLAFTNPTTNSFRRLVPGYEAPVNLVYSQRNRSAAIRIPVVSSPQAKRVEFRPPDPSCNPYLAFSAILMAGLDGIRKGLDPGDPMDVDIFELPREQAASIKTVPGSLEKALEELESDHDYLLEGDVFSKGLIDTWTEYKRKMEFDQIRLRPHPYEFFMYFDV
ncbi:MAG: type I glutamate--ammonia ligase [Methanomassiliicoccales archaeon]